MMMMMITEVCLTRMVFQLLRDKGRLFTESSMSHQKTPPVEKSGPGTRLQPLRQETRCTLAC